MANDLHFFGWRRTAAADEAVSENGRLHRDLPLSVEIQTANGHLLGQDQKPTTFYLLGPGDIAGLKPGAVRRLSSPSGTRSAETSKCVYVELAESDLAWRYTSDNTPPPNQGLQPWLMLLVGKTSEIWLERGGKVRITAAVLNAHDPGNAWRWAHIQKDEKDGIARLLSPRPLEASSDYLAVIVPVFKPDGKLWWQGQVANDFDLSIPAYYWWRFHTTDTTDDFKSLATRIDPYTPQPDDHLGYAPLAYYSNDTLPPAQVLELGGALTTDGSETPTNQAVLDHLAILRLHAHAQMDDKGRPIVQLPIYGQPWLGDPETQPWGQTLNQDPRQRAAAGLGAWAGIEWQELIVDAARQQMGAFYIASQRIRQLTLGLALSRNLWKTRLPSNPEQRMLLLGQSLARMATEKGVALDQITGRGRTLPPAMFSSAARRMLRPGTARARHTESGVIDSAELLQKANECSPLPAPDPAGLPHLAAFQDVFAYDLETFILDEGGIGLNWKQALEDETLFEEHGQSEEWEQFGFPVSADEQKGAIQEADVQFDQLVESALPFLREPEIACRPVILEKLDGYLQEAVDPTVAEPIVQQRVLATLTGLDNQPLTPPELCLDFNLPAWRFLRDYKLDLLLPGVEKMPTDRMTAVATNPIFVESFLTGLNQQALNELRWRNVPVAAGCTPLRRFWERIKKDGSGTAEDIRGIDQWAALNPPADLGDDRLVTPDAAGVDLVLVFRTELFRRYPQTLVYLAPRVPIEQQDDKWTGEPDFDQRIFPTFPGILGPDITFFGFNQPPAVLDDHWVVIEELPPGYSFYSVLTDVPDDHKNAYQNPRHGGDFAAAAFAAPVRVNIQGNLLKGNQP